MTEHVATCWPRPVYAVTTEHWGFSQRDHQKSIALGGVEQIHDGVTLGYDDPRGWICLPPLSPSSTDELNGEEV